MIEWKQFKKSIGFALHGLLAVFRAEQSFRLQTFAAVFVIVLAVVFGLRKEEWIILLFLIGAVLILELINSIFERVLDAFKPRLHPIVKDAKDMMAGAVFIMSLIALVVGLLIFWPYLKLLLLP